MNPSNVGASIDGAYAGSSAGWAIQFTRDGSKKRDEIEKRQWQVVEREQYPWASYLQLSPGIVSGAEDKGVTIELIFNLNKNDARWETIFSCFSLPTNIRGGYMDHLPDPLVTNYAADIGYFALNSRALTGPTGIQIYPDPNAPLAGCADLEQTVGTN